MTPRTTTKRRLWLVFAVSLTLQGICLFESRREPTFFVPIIDAGVYHDMAVRFARDGVLSDEAFWQPPLFPFLLGCLYRLVGVDIVAAKLLLAVLNAASCSLTAAIAARAFSPRVGLTAGLMLAAWGPFLVLGSQLLPAVLALFLNLIALRLWITFTGRRSWKLALVLGGVVGLSTLTVPNSIVLGLLFVAFERVKGFQTDRLRTAVRVPAILLGCALTIAPVTLRNYFVGGEWVVISTNSGINLYIGNNPDVDATLAVRPGLEWKRLARRSFVDGHYVSPARQDAWFRQQVRDYVRQHPADFLRGLAKKTLHFINAREIPRNIDAYVFRDDSMLLSILLWRAGSFAFPWGLAAPLAVIGILSARHLHQSPRNDDHSHDDPISPIDIRSAASVSDPAHVRSLRRLLLAYLLFYSASVILFFVSGRYRLPIVPAVVIFAAAGGWWLVDQLRSRTRPHATTASRVTILLAGLAAAIVVNLPITTPVDRVNFRAEMHMSVGATLTEQGRFPEAFEHLETALRLQPDYVEGHNKLAWAHFVKKNDAEAERWLRESLRLSSDNPEAWRILAEVLRRTDRVDEAREAFRHAIELDPTAADAHAGLASLLMEFGDDEAARPVLETAVRLNPTSGVFHLRYAELLLRLTRYAEAVHHFRIALTRTAPDDATLNTIAWTLATSPDRSARDCQLAIELGERLVANTKALNPVALDTLAAAYAECSRWNDAIRTIRRAVELAASSGDEVLLESLRPRLEWYESKSRAHRGK